MKISIYSTLFRLEKNPAAFNIKGALSNWSLYADQISIACGDDYSQQEIEKVAQEYGYPVSTIRTHFDFETDGQAYGKTENAALQNCDGEILIQNNFDERWGGDKDVLLEMGERLILNPNIGAYFIPTIDLYGSYDKYLSLAKKWYMHKEGFFRGPVNFGFKSDGKIDYNRSSTDELIDRNGNLVPTLDLLPNLTIELLREYVKRGMPISYHLGYCSFGDRIERSIWWSNYWKNTTGDENKHPKTIEEIANRETKEHGLPLWEGIK